jgi:hypothetical protein
VDIPRLLQAHVSLQAFTVVTTIPRNLNIDRNDTSSDMVNIWRLQKGGLRARGIVQKNEPFIKQADCGDSKKNPEETS